MNNKPALFLDRDGVINIDRGYVFRREEIEFCDGIFELVASANRLNYQVVIVTNQSGIGRGYYTKADFENLTEWMKQQFERRGGRIDAVYFCPHYSQSEIESCRVECTCRKPQPGMIRQAAADLEIDLENSVMVGDKPRDCEAGQRAGIKKLFLFNSAEVFNGAVNVESLDEITAHLEEKKKN